MAYTQPAAGGGGEGSVSVSSMIVTALASYATSASVVTSLAPYVTSASVVTALAPYVTSASVATSIANYITSNSSSVMIAAALVPYASAQGTATLDFGAFPGKSDTTVAVTGQAAIVSGSIVEAWIRPVATADHSADEHMLETLTVFAGNIVAATGFTIYGFNPDKNISGTQNVQDTRYYGGGDTRLYGQFTVAWCWA